MLARFRRWPLLALFAVQAFLSRGWFLGEVQASRDLLRLFIPLKHHLWSELHAGRWPQWWPWEALGMPLASLPLASVFHPTTLFFAVLPFQPALALQCLLPLPVAAFGAFRLGRALGVRRWAATITAAAYSLGGYFVSNTEFTFSSLAAAALPFVCLGALRLRRHRPRPLLLAVSMALLVLAGDPVLTYLAAMTVLAFAARRRRPLRVALGLLAAAVLAGLIAAPLLLPLSEQFVQSGRAGGYSYPSSQWALDLEMLEALVRPVRFGDDRLYRSVWLGLLTQALAVFGAVPRGRARVALGVIAALSLGLAATHLLPLWSWAEAVLPGWKAFRFPLKCIGPFTLVVAVLAGRGAQALVRRLKRPRLEVVLAAGVVLELGIVNGPLLATEPLRAAPPKLAQTLQRLGVSLDGPSYVWHWTRHQEGAADCASCAFDNLGPATGALYGLPTTNAYAPGFSLEYRELRVHSEWTWLGKAAPIFGSRYQIGNFGEDAGTLIERDQATQAELAELPGALPRAYLSTGVHRFSRSLVPKALVDEQFHPGDEVALASDEPGPADHPSEGAYVPATVRHEGGATVVTAIATAPSVLVLNEAYARGVQATENGAELPVFRVNHLARGVSLPPGEHTVRFEFHTPGLAAGLTLGAVGWALTLALATWQRRRRRGRRSSSG